MKPELARDPSALWGAFQALKRDEKDAVRACSLFWGPVNREEVTACLNHVEAARGASTRWTTAGARPLFARLESHSFLQRDGSCNPLLGHTLTLEITSGPEARYWLDAARAVLEKRTQAYWMPATPSLLRLAVYEGNEEKVKELLEKNMEQSYRYGSSPATLSDFFRDAVIGVPWLSTRPPIAQVEILSAKMQLLFATGEPLPGLDEIIAYFHRAIENPVLTRAASQLVYYDLLSLDFAGARKCAGALSRQYPEISGVTEGSIAFLEGRGREAVAHFGNAIAIIKKAEGKRKASLGGISGIFHVLSLLSMEDAALIPEARSALAYLGKGRGQSPASGALEALTLFREGLSRQAAAHVELLLHAGAENDAFTRALIHLAAHIVNPKTTAARQPYIEACFRRLSGAFFVLGAIHAEILKDISPDPSPYEAFLAPLGRRGLRSLTRFMESKDWERKLDTIELLLRGSAATAPQRPKAKRRLAFIIDPKNLSIQPVEQQEKGGKWIGSKKVSLERLQQRHPSLDYLTPQDIEVTRAIENFSYGWRRSSYLTFDSQRALIALAGHPAAFSIADMSKPVEITVVTPEIVVRETKDGFRIGLSHKPGPTDVVLEEESPGRWLVINFSGIRDAVALLGGNEIPVPVDAKPRILSLLSSPSQRISIRAEGKGLGEEAVPADPTPVLQLSPREQGLSVRIVVRPLDQDGPAYPPGEGAHTVSTLSRGTRKRAIRNLEAEKEQKRDVIDSCPHLARADEGSNEFVIDSLEESLELMMELQAFPGPHRLEWPEGKPLSVTLPLTAKSFKLALRRTQDWFSMDGQLEIDEGFILEFKELLERAQAARGRFIELRDGQFLALTHKLKRQLDRLQAVAGIQRGACRIHRLGIPALEEFLDDAGRLDTGDSWKKHVEEMRRAALLEPALPHLLQADLREYQEEGYRWMMRLAHWGAGACLADDMGVGKTVQAIAVTLEQARKGPVIVIAPTSVCPNWIAELGRFAPALQADLLATAGDRKEKVQAMGPMQVLVVSYTLLHMEAEILSEKKWAMAVLDEAQAIKNADTRRAQASLKLDAQFRLALTGTPIENYLEELWSLFNFVNPGLLGSKESFQKRFVASTNKEQAAESRQTLKALIKPFILRRTKSAVLSELPPRIEKTVPVVLTAEERSFYEALRRVAIERLTNLAEGAPGQKKIHILAEITRLRRACCHSRLVQPDVSLESSKLSVFLDLVEELRRNSHRALVFSQFVGHLHVVREALEAAGVSYQYLDGQSPAAERERSIGAFQGGDGDLFLISLKAGGLGLNLTAADFVFHLDPWWNPAVEDQATDRAHRIGQTRPVTIYRLIAQNTIEEKIIQLHQTKRDLAADLLSGAEMAASLSNEELLELIAG